MFKIGEEIKNDIVQIFLLAVVFVLIFILGGCASPPSKSEDSDHMAAEQGQPQPAVQTKVYQGPKIFGRGYYSKSKGSSDSNCSGKSSWNVSPDGRSGTMTQTSVRTYRTHYDNESGSLVGPGAFYGYGFCGY